MKAQATGPRGVVHRRAGGEPAFHSHAGGFTLLEMMLVLFISALLVSTVFGIVSSLTQLSHHVTLEQERDARTQGFVELCSRQLQGLPPAAFMRLRLSDSRDGYLPQLCIVDAPAPLSSLGGSVTVLEAEPMAGGYLRIVLRTLTEEQTLAWSMGNDQLGAKIILLEDVRLLEWRVFDAKSKQWQSVWNQDLPLLAHRRQAAGPEASTGGQTENPLLPPQRPYLVEMRLAQGADAPQRWIFWVPPARPPASTGPAAMQ